MTEDRIRKEDEVMEENMKKELKHTLEIPENVDEKMQDAYRQIYQGVVRMKPAARKTIPGWVKAAAAAVCIVCAGSGVLISNPALAKDLPIIGNIFDRLTEARENHPYGEKDVTAYGNIKENAQDIEDATSIASDQGVEISVSDAYCDGYDLYFTISARVEDEEMKTADVLDILEYVDEDSDLLLPFNVMVNGELTGINMVSGMQKTEDGAFVGLALVERTYLAEKEFPDQMHIAFGVDVISGKQAVVAGEPWTGFVEDEGRRGFKSIDGNWNLAFDVTKDESNNANYDVQAESGGFAIEKVAQTPSNLHIDFVMPAEWVERNPDIIVYDVNGNKVQKLSSTITEREDGSHLCQYRLEHSDSPQFTVQVIDKNSSVDGSLPVVGEMLVTLEQ